MGNKSIFTVIRQKNIHYTLLRFRIANRNYFYLGI